MEGAEDGGALRARVGEAVEGAGDAQAVEDPVGEGEGASVAVSVEHTRLNTAMPPSPPVAAIDTKSRVELVFVGRAIAAITPVIPVASVLTLTVAGECRDPVPLSLWNTTIWHEEEGLRARHQQCWTFGENRNRFGQHRKDLDVHISISIFHRSKPEG